MNTLFVGRNKIQLDFVHSTNSYANELLTKEKLPEGTIICANNQTGGRGQRGNVWESEPMANITLSVILTPTFLVANEQFILNKAMALAVADFVAGALNTPAQNVKNTASLADNDTRVYVKWPNDVFVGSKKIAGLLIENTLRNNSLISTVVGIGINVNQELFSPLAPNPTSLRLLTKNLFDIETCIEQLCSCIEARYLLLKSKQFEKLDEAYLRLMYRLGEWADYGIGAKIIKAKIIGVFATGKLMIETTDRQQQEYAFKEIVFLQ